MPLVCCKQHTPLKNESLQLPSVSLSSGTLIFPYRYAGRTCRFYCRRIKSIPLAVYATAVWLPVDASFPGNPYSLCPTFPKIAIMKVYSESPGQTFTNAFYHVVILESAVQECRSEAVESSLRGHTGCVCQTVIITIPAPIFLPEDHAS